MSNSKNIRNRISDIKSLEKSKVLGLEYGSASLEWDEGYERMIKILDLISNSDLEEVSNITKKDIYSILGNINNHLNQLVGFDARQFLDNRQKFKQNLEANVDQLLSYKPHFFVAGQNLSSNKLKEDEILEKFQKELNQIKNQAVEEKDKIIQAARRTSQGVSVDEAQKQFKEAANDNIKGIVAWSVISIFLIIILIILIYGLLDAKLSEEYDWRVIYRSIIRLSIIGLLGSLLAFGLKMLKSFIHQLSMNKHRIRLSNSLEAFVSSANMPEEQDRILNLLVNAIANFGNTGILNEKEAESTQNNILIDTITKNLPSK